MSLGEIRSLPGWSFQDHAVEELSWMINEFVPLEMEWDEMAHWVYGGKERSVLVYGESPSFWSAG